MEEIRPVSIDDIDEVVRIAAMSYPGSNLLGKESRQRHGMNFRDDVVEHFLHFLVIIDCYLRIRDMEMKIHSVLCKFNFLVFLFLFYLKNFKTLK